jgi:hypothetical protein
MARFISRSNNLRIVIRPGLPGSRETGALPRNMISVRFKDGELVVPDSDEETIKELRRKIAQGTGDFIEADEKGKDPFAATRQSSEPTHEVVTMDHGSPGSRILKPGVTPTLSPELQKAVNEAAKAIAMEMLPGMVKATLQGIVEANKASETVAVKSERATETTSAGFTSPVTPISEGSGTVEAVETVSTDAPKRRGRPAGSKTLEQKEPETIVA